MKALSAYSNLTQRLITGIIGAALIISSIAFSPWTYFSIFAVICFLSLLEFYNLVGLDGLHPQKWFGTFCGVLVYVLSYLIESGILAPHYYYLIFPMVSLVYLMKLYKKFERKPFTNIAYTFLGIFYIAVPYTLLNIIAFEGGKYNYEIILGCLLLQWASDTGAYFAGTFFGKSKLFERISPKKSWEGFYGGAFLAMAFALGLSYFMHSLSVYQWIIVGVIIIVGGTFGDLIESLLKRSIEIKDSANTLPGHGGFLDRFDGLLISAPFILVFIEFISEATSK